VVDFERVPHPHTRPGTGLNLEIGFAFGGDGIADAGDGSDEIQAGNGFLSTVGGMWTPLWASDDVGFGLEADVGLKVTHNFGGGLSFWRFPVSGVAHTLIRTGKTWWLVGKAGLYEEIGTSMSGSGVGVGFLMDSHSDLGWIAEAGFLRTDASRFATAFLLRFTALTFRAQGEPIGASNVAFMISTPISL
jgi:hypothetical protein